MVNAERYHSPVIRTGLLLSMVAFVGAAITAWVVAGRAEGPQINIVRPTTFIGQTGSFEATVQTPDAELRALDAHLEQNGNTYPLFSLDAGISASVQQESNSRLRISRTFDRNSHPDLVAGPARVVVRATRPVLYGYREATSETTLDVTVRLSPPRLSHSRRCTTSTMAVLSSLSTGFHPQTSSTLVSASVTANIQATLQQVPALLARTIFGSRSFLWRTTRIWRHPSNFMREIQPVMLPALVSLFAYSNNNFVGLVFH